MVTRLSLVALVLASLIILVAPIVTAADASPQDKDAVLQDYNRARQHFHRGLDQFKAKRYDQAGASFEKALRILPDYAEAALQFGLCYYYNDDFETAGETIEEAKNKYLRWHHTYYDIKIQIYNEAQNRINELNKQIADIEVRKSQASGDQVSKLSQQIAELQQIKHSHESVDRPMVTEPVVPAKYYFHCGNCYLKMQKWNEAFAEYAQAIEIDPNYGEAHNNLAYIYYLAKQYDNAWEHLQLAEENGAEVNPKVKEMLQEALQK